MQSNRIKKIFLARHGESEANQQKLISGQINTPLSEKGKQQALWLCEVLQDEPLTEIITSTLQRTIDTARPTAAHHRLEIQSFDNLKEMHFGPLQGCHHGQFEYISGQVAISKAQQNSDDNEDNAEFTTRVESVLDSVFNAASGNILIVGHRKTNEVILAILFKQALNDLPHKSINIKNKYLYEIELGHESTVQTIRLGGEHHGKKFAGIKDD